MFTRRQTILTAIPAALATQADAAQGDFGSFVAGVYAEATAAGIRRDILDAAFAGVQPNQRVIDKDRRQAEFNMTWTRYKALVISEKRIANGRIAISQNRPLFSQVESRYGVAANVIAGIWGLESSFGAETGDYRVIESLATLAWEGRRAVFFRSELMAALKILNNGDITPARMTGSYAGAMGQPQFMPTSFLRLAVDFDGDGRRDIWTNKADVLGSIAIIWRAPAGVQEKPGASRSRCPRGSAPPDGTSDVPCLTGFAWASSPREDAGLPQAKRRRPCWRRMAPEVKHLWSSTTSCRYGAITRPTSMRSRLG